jgi:redox-sensitive bicupin YhaK (pirin superfamily)
MNDQSDGVQSSPIVATVPLGLHWPTLDPFLFCAHHHDQYPAGNDQLGVDPVQLKGRNMGSDFTVKDGFRMYHGSEVPGFPRHPHRGFETITLARHGMIDHSDSLGARARFGAGDVQWMTAGRGIVHSEMFPLLKRAQDNPAELFQVWLNLPAKNKMVPPYFTMFWADEIPRVRMTDAAGRTTEVLTIAGPLGDMPPPPPPDSWASDPGHRLQVWRIAMEPGAEWMLPAGADGDGRVLYIYDGAGVRVSGVSVANDHGVQLDPTVDVSIVNGASSSELLLLSGCPIGEPVAQHGPFVMNSRSELQQAFNDYNDTGFGGWPWREDDPIHGAVPGRFAEHADGRVERPGEKA